LTSPIPANSAHPLIPVLSDSRLETIKPDAERQNNWTKVLLDTLVSFAELSDKADPSTCRQEEPWNLADDRAGFKFIPFPTLSQDVYQLFDEWK
jgi:hypothetical protein